MGQHESIWFGIIESDANFRNLDTPRSPRVWIRIYGSHVPHRNAENTHNHLSEMKQFDAKKIKIFWFIWLIILTTRQNPTKNNRVSGIYEWIGDECFVCCCCCCSWDEIMKTLCKQEFIPLRRALNVVGASAPGSRSEFHFKNDKMKFIFIFSELTVTTYGFFFININSTYLFMCRSGAFACNWTRRDAFSLIIIIIFTASQ